MPPSDTVNYYDTHADTFFAETQGVDMSPLHQRFLARLPIGAHILDAGCGSGRDSNAFMQLGYRVTAFDASAKLAALAQVHTGLPIAQRSFADVDEIAIYDGIWPAPVCSICGKSRLRKHCNAFGEHSSQMASFISASNMAKVNANTMDGTLPMRLKVG